MSISTATSVTYPAIAGRPRLSATTATSASDAPLDSTVDLLARVRAGEGRALEQLFQRCLPPLKRWARGQLPGYARDMADTQDIVQDAILSTLHNLGSFESRHPGALQKYLRQAVVNRVRDEIRRVSRRPVRTELDEQEPDDAPSPLQRAMGHQGMARYENALRQLRDCDRTAITARFELQKSYREVAVILGKPNANAARVAVARALAKLVCYMDRLR
jgi:RNA polymerase sigma-70 factor (ECF subfamily)